MIRAKNQSPSQPALVVRDLRQRFEKIRSDSLKLVDGLSDADVTVQSMPDASPAKWHLAHTSWFFESVILKPHLPGYKTFDPTYAYLFNSYYEALGPRHARPSRGLLTRPSLDQICAYRAHVDAAMVEVLSSTTLGKGILDGIELGLNHEQQHQELLLTDLLHLFAQNPVRPAYRSPEPLPMSNQTDTDLVWLPVEGGIHQIGRTSDGFAFDCEGPEHAALIPSFELASKPVTTGE